MILPLYLISIHLFIGLIVYYWLIVKSKLPYLNFLGVVSILYVFNLDLIIYLFYTFKNNCSGGMECLGAPLGLAFSLLPSMIILYLAEAQFFFTGSLILLSSRISVFKLSKFSMRLIIFVVFLVGIYSFFGGGPSSIYLIIPKR